MRARFHTFQWPAEQRREQAHIENARQERNRADDSQYDAACAAHAEQPDDDQCQAGDDAQPATQRDLLTQSGVLEDLAPYYQTNGTWAGVESVLAQLTGRGQGRGRPPLLLADATASVVYDERHQRAGTALSEDERSSALPIEVNGVTVGYLLPGTAGRGTLATNEQVFLDQLQRTLLIAALIAAGLGIAIGLVISRTVSRPSRSWRSPPAPSPRTTGISACKWAARKKWPGCRLRSTTWPTRCNRPKHSAAV